jgi:hypothetical protein
MVYLDECGFAGVIDSILYGECFMSIIWGYKILSITPAAGGELDQDSLVVSIPGNAFTEEYGFP